jgi:hypothetical protein
MFDGIAFRGFEHETLVAMATHAGIPVWNCLCDEYHPTQVLADFMTVQETFGRLKGIRIAYVGDGRNNSSHTTRHAAIRSRSPSDHGEVPQPACSLVRSGKLMLASLHRHHCLTYGGRDNRNAQEDPGFAVQTSWSQQLGLPACHPEWAAGRQLEGKSASSLTAVRCTGGVG